MIGLRIADGVGDDPGLLAFDLSDVLRALGPEARGWTWSVSRVGARTGEAGSGEFMATGDGADELEASMRAGSRVGGAQLAAMADRADQVIWGAFRAFQPGSPERECARVLAVDSTFYDVWCRDTAIAERIRRAFTHARPITASYEADNDLGRV